MSTVRYSPAQLSRLLRLPEPTPEQAAVISAPLGPLAVIAGAGSGKSETMAARLVWLVANGMVRPDRVLGLTFTRKAAAEFADRVRSRLERLRRAGLEGTAPVRVGPAGSGPVSPGAASPGAASTGGEGGPEDPFGGDPVIGTYHAYAGRLVSDNALREGLEPSMRLITPALSWQLAAGIVAAYDGPMDEINWTPQTVTAAVLELSGDLSEHLRDSGDVTTVGLWLTAEHDALPGRIPASVRKIIATQRAREQLLPLVIRYATAKAAREVLDHGDQVALAARIASRHPEVGAAERARYQVVLLDEYQDTSHAQLVLLRARSAAPTSGCLLAIRAASATWSPWSRTSRAALAAAYRLTSGKSCSLARWVEIIFRTAWVTRPGSASCSAVSHRPTAVTSPVSRRCSDRSPASSSTAAVTVCGVQVISSIGPS